MAEIDISNTESFKTEEDFYGWLKKHHNNCSELWIRIYKKGSGIESINWSESVRAALCWGWIDGVKKSYDDKSYIQRFSPRRSKSSWSKRNTEHVESLIDAGLMQETGMAHVRSAKADGRWDAAYKTSEMSVPEDFVTALDAKPHAKEFFNTLTKSSKYVIAQALLSAKKPETRQRRFDKYLVMLESKTKPQ
ncbi:YdeI/OmpD-associated family protein [Ferrimonas futtsuensis]|uniref:YdeI/OmpD-associated family protein n=1 Tax=Ferrimonas futtsuensis TaxID=364764 RepID=UPI0009FD067C|nr:YdeI/OmpD-associated family protein [Ferrimonas futtsuensis]